MREFWWIRHGQTEWNDQGRWQGHSDPPLSLCGEEQAVRLGQRIGKMEFDAIFASDLIRARRSAEVAFGGRPLTVDKRLREVNFGEFEGHTVDDCGPQLKAAFQAWWRDPFNLRAPGGESLGDLAERIKDWIGSLPPQGKFAVVTHGGVIRTVIWGITGAPLQGRWTLTLDNTSITRIRDSAKRTTIDCINDTAHLTI